MPLKLFHSTGSATLLQPGQASVAPHPGRLVVFGCLWLGLACNMAVWRAVAGDGEGWRTVLGSTAVMGGGAAVFLGLLGWRRTLRLALSLLFIAGALFAAGVWTQHLPVEALWRGPPRTWLPAWTSFLRGRVLGLVLLLAVVPIVGIWAARMRQLSVRSQWRMCIIGMCIGAVTVAAGMFLLP